MISRGYTRQINGMTLKVASNLEELEKFGHVNDQVHGQGLTDYCREIFWNKPDTLFIYLEKGEVLATLAYLPNIWKMDSVELEVAEMGFVATLPSHRGKGLFGTLYRVYEEIALQKGVCVSVLRGIPYFYSKFGYTFALPTDSDITFTKEREHHDTTYKIREAGNLDRAGIEQSYQGMFKDNFLHTSFKSFKGSPRFYVFEKEGEPPGFFRTEFPLEPHVVTISLLSKVDNLETFAQDTADFFTGTTMVRIHRMPWMGSKDGFSRGWKWQVKVLDFHKLILQMIPILEKRIECDITNFTLSNFRHTIHIKHENTKLLVEKVVREFPGGEVDLRIPPNLLPKLLLADCTLDDLRNIHPDVLVKDKRFSSRLLPKLTSLPIGVY